MTYLVSAHVAEVRTDQKFYSSLMKKPLAVAMFYCQDKCSCQDKDYQCHVQQLIRLFNGIGKQGYFIQGGVQFLKSNVKNQTLSDLAYNLGIQELPAFILFKNGVQLKNNNDSSIMLTGWATYDQLESFIREHLEDDIEVNTKKRAEELAKLREAERWSYLWYRPYYWGCSPCWGPGYGPCGGGWGCGIGCGIGGCGPCRSCGPCGGCCR